MFFDTPVTAFSKQCTYVHLIAFRDLQSMLGKVLIGWEWRSQGAYSVHHPSLPYGLIAQLTGATSPHREVQGRRV